MTSTGDWNRVVRIVLVLEQMGLSNLTYSRSSILLRATIRSLPLHDSTQQGLWLGH